MFNRREFLKTSAIGAAALSSGNLYGEEKAAKAPARFIFLRKSSGLIPDHFALPSFSEKLKAVDKKKGEIDVSLADHKLPDFFKSVEGLKEHMTILQGMSARMMSVNGHHPQYSPLALVNSAGKPRDLIRKSIDFELASLYPSPFTHIGFSAASHLSGIGPGFSIKAPGLVNFEYLTPNAAMADIFGSVAQNEEEKKDYKLNDGMMKFILKRQNKKTGEKELTALERKKIHHYEMATKELVERNKKVAAMKSTLLKFVPKLDKKYLNNKIGTVDKQIGHAEIAVAALRAGLTNVVTIDLDSNHSHYDALNLKGGSVHDIGHNKTVNSIKSVEARALIQKQHMDVIALMVDKLKKTPEGKGNMFDNTFIVYLTDCGETHHPKGTEWPFVIFSGKNIKFNMKGRYHRFAPYLANEHKTLGNLYTSILNAFGNPIAHYGGPDVNLQKNKIDQFGPIKGLFS